MRWLPWRSVLEPFLKSNLTFAILKLLGNKLSLIERLKSWQIGLAKISAPSFRNLPDKLLMPTALDGFKPFKILNIFSDVSEHTKFKSLKSLSMLSSKIEVC